MTELLIFRVVFARVVATSATYSPSRDDTCGCLGHPHARPVKQTELRKDALTGRGRLDRRYLFISRCRHLLHLATTAPQHAKGTRHSIA